MFTPAAAAAATAYAPLQSYPFPFFLSVSHAGELSKTACRIVHAVSLLSVDRALVMKTDAVDV